MTTAEAILTGQNATDGFGRLDNQTVVVTGASSGIGRATALELAAAGADVVVHFAKSGDRAAEVADEIRSMGRQARTVQADFTNAEQTVGFVESVVATGVTPDLWFLNAGADLLTTDLRRANYSEKLRVLLDVDVRAGVLLAKEICEKLRHTGGAIVTIGWDQAERGMGGDSGELFALAKNAVMGATRSLAVSYAPNVRVNCVAPGWIRTAW